MHFRNVVAPLASLLVALASGQSVLAEAPFSFDQAPGKLPKNVVPKHYRLHLEPDAGAATFHGKEQVTVEVRTTTRSIVVNSVGLEITRAVLRDQKGSTHPLASQVDTKLQTLTLTSSDDVAPGTAEVELEWNGKLSEQPEGLFITTYQAGDKEKRALVTQMEPADARHMFPCWDEPAYRAEFELSAVVPANQLALSNMPVLRESLRGDGRKQVDFQSTPAMASYLVAFACGEFEQLNDEVDGIKLRMVTTEGKIDHARYALEATKQIVSYYHEYFGVRFPLPKLDQFCFPGFPAGGMENWGAIFYKDSTMLYDPAKSPESTRQHVFAVVAHEIAHQWFGDLVTMGWWDNLWLNEGFASWMGTKATDHFNPDWQIWLSATGSKEWAMSLDARATTHPIQQPVTDEHQATAAFDEITYSKGQAFLRMLETYLGEDTFREGIRRYIATHAYGNTTTADLWTALAEASGKPVQELAADWTQQPGFPLVEVNRNATGESYQLTQERFTIHQPTAKPLTWQIPVSLAPADAPAQISVQLLSKTAASVTAPKTSAPIKANAGASGYYRVAYDEVTFRELSDRATSLPNADRLNLLNDTWALVQAGKIPATTYLNLVAKVFPQESNYVLWDELLSVLGFMDFLQQNQTGRAAYRIWACNLCRPQLERLGWETKPGEPELDGRLRASLIRAMGAWGDPDVIAAAHVRYTQFLANPGTISRDLREPILFIVGRGADESDYNRLLTIAINEHSTELKMEVYDAISANRDPALASRTLAVSLTDQLPASLAVSLVSKVASQGEHPQLAWEFAHKNLDGLLAKLGSLAADHYIPNLFRNFSDAKRADELESFAAMNLPPEASYSVAKASDDIRFKAELKQRLLPELDAWISTQPGHKAVTEAPRSAR